MPYDVHDGSGHGNSGHLYAYEHEHEDPTDVFVPHVEPEDEETVTFQGTGEGELNLVALGALINRQARDWQLDGLLQVHETPERLNLPITAVRAVIGDDVNPDKRLAVINRLDQAAESRPFLPVQTSVNVYTEMRARFNNGVATKVDLGLTYKWPVLSSDNPEIVTATTDLLRYYQLRLQPNRPLPESRPAGPFKPQDRSELRRAMDDLRSDTGAKIVNLYTDWRMWLAWLDAGNPIICLGNLGKSLREGEVGHTAPDKKKPFFKHPFIIAGYEIACSDGDRSYIHKVVRDIGEGARSQVDVPLTFVVRNSFNDQWGERGNLRIPFAHFENQFREGYGLLFNDNLQPPQG